jgi:hypothetical protein
MKSLSFLAELYLGVRSRGSEELGVSAGIHNLDSHVGYCHCSLALVAPSQEGKRTRPFTVRGNPILHSLSPNNVHSEAKCILHSVRLALWDRDRNRAPAPTKDSARRGLRSSQASPALPWPT